MSSPLPTQNQFSEIVMKVIVKSLLPCSAELVWNELQKSSLLIEVTWPIVVFTPISPKAIPLRWKQGTSVCIRCRLFGLFSISPHVILFERIDHARKELQSRERDSMIRKWDHLVRVEVVDDNTARYTDEIEVNAGILTIPVALFVQCFYRYRQRRWLNVAGRLADNETQVVVMAKRIA